jgi:hypothetical protein
VYIFYSTVDHSRVKLSTNGEDDSADYINGNYLPVSCYILVSVVNLKYEDILYWSRLHSKAVIDISKKNIHFHNFRIFEYYCQLK